MPQQSTDDAIETVAQDMFDRGDYAEQAAKLIATMHSWKGSSVFALTGPWGSGKTSLINLIVKALPSIKNRGSGEGVSEYSVVKFTPWATHDVIGVLSDFYTSLASALPTGGVQDSLGKKFGKLLEIASPAAKFIPVVGDAVSDFAGMASDRLMQSEPWDALFKKASEELRENGVPILIVVDDIDRLQGDELLTVLKVIRLLGRFPGVQYLLAYDEDSLAHTLRTANAARDDSSARRYIEKIVQYPLPVPPLLDVQLFARLNEGIGNVVHAHRGETRIASMHRLRDVNSAMLATLRTPRAIDRYLAQVDYELSLHVAEEIDDEDVIILALLRTAFPSLYAALPMHQHELTTGTKNNALDLFAKRSDDDVKFTGEELLEHYVHAQGERQQAEQILHALFPILRYNTGSSTPCSISAPSYFGRYFAMGVLTKHDIADSVVRQAVQDAGAGNGHDLAQLLKTSDVSLALLAFEKSTSTFTTLWQQTPETGRDSFTLGVMRALLPLNEDLEAQHTLLFTIYEQIIVWISRHVLPLVSDNIDPNELSSALALIGDATTLTTLFVKAENAFDRQPGPPERRWWVPAVAAATSLVLQAFLDHLRERDNADRYSPMRMTAIFRVAADSGVNLDSVRSEIAKGIDRGEFTVADLAARFVYPSIPGEHLEFTQESFARTAPNTDTDWYDSTPVEVDESDTSWSNRRRYATGRASRPPQVHKNSTT